MSLNLSVKEKLEVHFDNLLEMLVENYEFDKVLSKIEASDCDCSYDEWVDVYADEFPTINFRRGVTRIAIIDKSEKYVIKIDMKGFDYSCREEENYKSAEAELFGQYFAPVEFLMYFNFTDTIKIPVFVSPMCEINVDEVMSLSRNGYYKSKIEDGIDVSDDEEFDYEEDTDQVRCAFEEFYGVDRTDALYDFMDDNCINDVHSENVGFLDGKLVVLDYAGY